MSQTGFMLYMIGVTVLVTVSFSLIFLYIGYTMGRSSVKPKEKKTKEVKDVTPIEEPEGDLFNDLLIAEDDPNRRIDTLKP